MLQLWYDSWARRTAVDRPKLEKDTISAKNGEKAIYVLLKCGGVDYAEEILIRSRSW